MALAKKIEAKDTDLVRSEWPRVRRVISGGQVRWQIDARPSGAREHVKTEREALVRAEALAKTRLKQGEVAISMPPALRVMAIECQEKLAPYGRSLRDATEFYVAALEAEEKRQASLNMKLCLEEWRAEREADYVANRIAK